MVRDGRCREDGVVAGDAEDGTKSTCKSFAPGLFCGTNRSAKIKMPFCTSLWNYANGRRRSLSECYNVPPNAVAVSSQSFSKRPQPQVFHLGPAWPPSSTNDNIIWIRNITGQQDYTRKSPEHRLDCHFQSSQKPGLCSAPPAFDSLWHEILPKAARSRNRQGLDFNMTFWTFGNSHGKKRKERLKPAPRPPTSNGVGYGGSNYSVSTVNFPRPSLEPQPAHQHHSRPPSRPRHGVQGDPYGNPHATVSRLDMPMRPPHTSPHGPESYGPPSGQMIQWVSPPSLPNTVYLNQNQSSNQHSLLHIPSAVTGGLHKASKSVTNLNARYLTQGAALYDQMSSKLDAVITCIDEEKFSGDERDLSE